MWASSGVNLSVATVLGAWLAKAAGGLWRAGWYARSVALRRASTYRVWLVEMLDAMTDLARFWVKKALGVAVTVGLRESVN